MIKQSDILQKRLDRNYNDYLAQLRGKTADELIALAPEITAAQQLRDELACACSEEDATTLLQLDDPMKAVLCFWIEEQDKTHGEKIGSFGLTEHTAGSDAAGQTTVAVKDGDSYVINGSKCFNTNGPVADYTVVYCLTDPALGTKGMAAFVVEKGTPGFVVGNVEDKMGIRSAQVSDMHLNDVRVPAENMIAKPGEGFKLAMKTLDGGRIGVAAQGLGIAKGAFEVARKYMMERQQFGKPICKQQYLAFKMAELQTKIEAAELLLFKAAVAKEEGKPYSVPAAMAKLTCTNVAMEVATEAVQMLGGNGYMKEYHVERMMRDAKITQIYEGTNEIQKLVISGPIFR